jgi:hypothetical protein
MIGFSFIFDARLLILAVINNESYVISKIDIRFKLNYRAVFYYNGSLFKINPSFVFNCSSNQFPSFLWVEGLVTPAQN